MPDAWQFDAPGCQDAPGRFRIDHLPMGALSKTCPALQGTVLSIQIKDVTAINPIYEYPESFRQMVLGNFYRDQVQTADPAKRHFLARFVFDHTLSVVGATTPGVDCGGFEVPMRFETFAATYLNAEDQEVSFGSLGNRAVTSKGSGTCVPMAARAATWGAIKGQYRR